MNLQETHTLRALDEHLQNHDSAIIETQYGDCLIKKTAYRGYVAVVRNGKVHNAFGKTPATAFLNLGREIKTFYGDR